MCLCINMKVDWRACISVIFLVGCCHWFIPFFFWYFDFDKHYFGKEGLRIYLVLIAITCTSPLWWFDMRDRLSLHCHLDYQLLRAWTTHFFFGKGTLRFSCFVLADQVTFVTSTSYVLSFLKFPNLAPISVWQFTAQRQDDIKSIRYFERPIGPKHSSRIEARPMGMVISLFSRSINDFVISRFFLQSWFNRLPALWFPVAVFQIGFVVVQSCYTFQPQALILLDWTMLSNFTDLFSLVPACLFSCCFIWYTTDTYFQFRCKDSVKDDLHTHKIEGSISRMKVALGHAKSVVLDQGVQ